MEQNLIINQYFNPKIIRIPEIILILKHFYEKRYIRFPFIFLLIFPVAFSQAQSIKPSRFNFKLGVNSSFVRYKDAALFVEDSFQRRSGTFEPVVNLVGAFSYDIISSRKVDLVAWATGAGVFLRN